MARSEEIAKLTASLSLDNQSFIKELSNIKKQSRNLSKDFDVATKSIENAENKMEAYATALNKGEKAIESNSKKLEMQTKQYDDLFKKVEKQVKAYEELKNELNDAETALSKINKTSNLEAYSKQEKAVNDLRKALENKGELIQKNSHKLQQYSTDIDKTTNDMKKLENSMNDIKSSMASIDGDNPLEELSNSSDEANSTISDVVSSLVELTGVSKITAAAIATVFTKGAISGAIEYDNAITTLRISLGLAEEEANSFYKEIKDIADNGYSLEGATEAATILEKRFNLTNKETKYLAQSMELLNGMGYDYNNTVRFMTSAVNDWGMTHSEALDMIIAGEQTGMNISQDWLDTLVEYTPILSTLGIEAKDTFLLIDEAINATGMNTDQATDMVKEFLLTLTDGSTTSKDAFKDLGINIDDLKKQIDDGSITTIDAMKKVSQAIMDVGDDTERARLLKEIFKGTVEYGSEGVIQAWANLGDEVINTSGAMDEAKQAYEESYAAMQQDLSNSWKELSQTIGSKVLPKLTDVMEFTNNTIKILSFLPSAFTYLGNDIDNVFEGMRGKFYEFILGVGSGMADFADTIGMDEMADSLREWGKSIDEEHKALSQRIKERNEENERLNTEFSEYLNDIWGTVGDNIPSELKTKFTADTTDVESKIESFKNLTLEEKTMVLNCNDIPAKERINYFNSLSIEDKQALIDADPSGALGVMALWDSLSPDQKTAIINGDATLAMNCISTWNSLDPEEKTAVLKGNNSHAISAINRVNSSKTPDKNTSINAKDNASSVIDTVNDKKVKNKSFTITGVFKTIGNAVSNFFGGKGSKSAYTNQGKSIPSEYSVSSTLLSENTNSNPLENQGTNSPSLPNPLPRATQKTPIANKGSNISDSIKYNIEMLTELENRIKMVTNSLSALDTKMEQAVGSEKIKYLQEQNKLYEEQKKIQKELEDTLNKQRNYYKSVLNSKGFNFTSDGNFTNYEEKLASMEKYVESLEKSAKSAQDALSKVDSNSKNKSSLEKKAEAAQSKYETEKDKLDEVKKYLQAYIDVQMTELPKCKEEWDKLNNSIVENNNEIKKLEREKWTLNIESQWTVLNQDLDKINNQLEMIDVLMENAFGNDKSKLIAEKISLLEKQKSELASNLSYLKSIQSELSRKLTGYGFKFDSNGNISNYVDQLNKLKETSTEFDDAKKLVDAYLDLFLDKIPDVEKEIVGLQNAIKDSYKEQLEITKDIESKITEVYKKQLEERKDIIDKELKARVDLLEKEKKAYNDARKEADYNKDYNKQMETIADLEKQIDILSRDNSLSGQKKLQELMKQLTAEQEKLQEMVQDKMDEQVNDMFDKESDRLEQEADKVKENLDDKYSDEKLQQIVKDTLSSGIFVGVNGEIQELQSALLNFTDKFGDGLSITGDLIKSELISNLEVAIDTFKDLDRIMSNLDLGKYNNSINLDYSSVKFNPPSNEGYIKNDNTKNITVNMNKPLIEVSGNVDHDVVKDLEKAAIKIKNDIISELARSVI